MKNLFVLIFITISVFSCSESETLVKDEVDYNIALRTNCISNLENELSNYWYFLWTEYSMEIICSCECEDVLIVQDFIYHDNYPTCYSADDYEGYSCEELYDIYKSDCEYIEVEHFAEFTQDLINETESLSNDEKTLISSLIEDVVINKSIDKSVYVGKWENLNSTSEYDNNLSLILLETAFATQNFIDDNPDVFDNQPQALASHVMGGISGGLMSCFVYGTRSVIEDSGTEDGLINAMINGAIGGALMAI